MWNVKFSPLGNHMQAYTIQNLNGAYPDQSGFEPPRDCSTSRMILFIYYYSFFDIKSSYFDIRKWFSNRSIKKNCIFKHKNFFFNFRNSFSKTEINFLISKIRHLFSIIRNLFSYIVWFFFNIRKWFSIILDNTDFCPQWLGIRLWQATVIKNMYFLTWEIFKNPSYQHPTILRFSERAVRHLYTRFSIHERFQLWFQAEYITKSVILEKNSKNSVQKSNDFSYDFKQNMSQN